MLQKHSVTINGHPTSFSLEKEFYSELKRICTRDKCSLSSLITKIDNTRDTRQNLSSALRLHVLKDLKSQTLNTKQG